MAATLIGLTGLATQAQEAELLPLLPAWDVVYTVRGSAGYKDNVFLSHADPQASALLSGEAELMVLHHSLDGPQFTFFANAAGNYFPAVSHQEYTAFAQAQLEHEFTERLGGSLAAQYFAQSQVLDLSLTETNRQAAAARGHTLTLEPTARANLPGHHWLSLGGVGTRQFYAAPLDDSWEGGLKLSFGRDYGRNSSLSLTYFPSWRFYDSDEARAADGTPIPGTQRERTQHDVRLSWRHHWDPAGRWRSTVVLSGRKNAENGGGYSDYTRWAATAQLRYRAKPWEAEIEGRLGRYQYSSQTVSDSDRSLRRRTDWSVSLRVERELTKHLKLGAHFEHEQTYSNDSLEEYRVNSVSAELQWEF